jgi:hypothetical protein
MLSVCTFTARRGDHHQIGGPVTQNSLHKRPNPSYPPRSDCFVLVCLTVEITWEQGSAMHLIWVMNAAFHLGDENASEPGAYSLRPGASVVRERKLPGGESNDSAARTLEDATAR